MSITNERLAEVAFGASRMIEVKGLAKGSLIDHRGGLCARGAVRVVMGEHLEYGRVVLTSSTSSTPQDVQEAERAIAGVLGAELPDGFHMTRNYGGPFAESEGVLTVEGPNTMAMWNDSSDRTQTEVVEFLRRAGEVFAARHKQGEIEATVPAAAPSRVMSWDSMTSSGTITYSYAPFTSSITGKGMTFNSYVTSTASYV